MRTRVLDVALLLPLALLLPPPPLLLLLGGGGGPHPQGLAEVLDRDVRGGEVDLEALLHPLEEARPGQGDARVSARRLPGPAKEKNEEVAHVDGVGLDACFFVLWEENKGFYHFV